nr:unnamed protein product [Spirometra erinaceieuropaei]
MPCRRAVAAAAATEKLKTLVELVYRGRPAVSCSTGAELVTLLATSTNAKRKSKSKDVGQNQAGRLLLLEVNEKSLRLRKAKRNSKATLDSSRGGRTVKRLKVSKLTACRQLHDVGALGSNLLLLQFGTGSSSSSSGPAKKPHEVLVLRFQDTQVMTQLQNLVRGVREDGGPVDTRPMTIEETGEKGQTEGERREEKEPGSAVYIWRREGSGRRSRYCSPVRQGGADLREVLYMKRINFAATNREPSMEYTRVSVFSEAPFDFPTSLLTVSSTTSSSSSSLSVPSPPSPHVKPKVVM